MIAKEIKSDKASCFRFRSRKSITKHLLHKQKIIVRNPNEHNFKKKTEHIKPSNPLQEQMLYSHVRL